MFGDSLMTGGREEDPLSIEGNVKGGGEKCVRFTMTELGRTVDGTPEQHQGGGPNDH